MQPLEIIGIPQSTYVRAVRMAAHEKGVDYVLSPEPPHSETVNRLSPMGKVPVMRHDKLELCESRAIAGYIDHMKNGPSLFPKEPIANALCEKWVSLVNTAYDPLFVRRYILGYVFPKTADGSPDRAAIDLAAEEMKPLVGVLDKALGATGYLVGDRPTYADINLYPILYYMSQLPEGSQMIESSPNLKAHFAAMSARESARATVPPPPR